MNRREFLARAGAGLGALGMGATASGGQPATRAADLPILVFSKHLQFLGYGEMATTAAKLGFAGIDLTVRPGGHVLPQRSETDLPEAVQAVRDEGLTMNSISTGVTRPDERWAPAILKTARENGIQQYRVGMRHYRLSDSIEGQAKQWVSDIRELGKLNQSIGIMGAVQNHSRFHLGGLIWDLWEAIKSSDPASLSCHYDISHAVAEAAISWPVGFNLLKSRISALIVKDFEFTQSQRGLNRRWVPLGQGKVPWEQFWPMVREAGLDVPVILHMEYGDRDNPEEMIQFLRQDLKTLRSMLSGTWQRSA